jgi:hypothetical protein
LIRKGAYRSWEPSVGIQLRTPFHHYDVGASHMPLSCSRLVRRAAYWTGKSTGSRRILLSV